MSAKQKAFERWWHGKPSKAMRTVTSKESVAYLTFEAGWSACARSPSHKNPQVEPKNNS